MTMLMHGELATFIIAVLRYGSIFFIATGFYGLEGIWNEMVSFMILLWLTFISRHYRKPRNGNCSLYQDAPFLHF
jgi:hypothetical protein